MILRSILYLMLTIAAAAQPTSEQIEFFEKKIRPVLAENCYKCHSNESKKIKGDLYLDSLKGLLTGGEAGPAVNLKDPDKSLIVVAMAYKDEDLEMPPKKQLPAQVVEDFRKWIKMGAPWPGGGAKFIDSKEKEFAERKEFWAWQPVNQPAAPEGNEIDFFIEKKRTAAGLRGSPAADRRTLIRRLYLDLVGLPPTAKEISAFLDDSSPEAYEQLVDRLLTNKHFGEKWARHWMDLMRYAESYGHEFDYTIPNAHPYRDYLIRAFNNDVSYDQLIKEHIAGDLLKNPRRAVGTAMNESIIGPASLFFGEMVHAPTDVGQDEADRIDNQIDVITKSFLGMTVACARCHDHKFDAIRAKDYYALSSFLQSTRQQQAQLDSTGKIKEGLARLHSMRKLMHADKLTAAQADKFKAYLSAAAEVFMKSAEKTEAPSKTADSELIFEDFEKDLSKWKKTGAAFNSSPAKGAIFGQMAVSGFSGKKFINTYHKSDRTKGSLKSAPFTIRHDYINFLMGGGENKKTLYVRLLVNGKEVHRATGRNNERLLPRSWNVKAFNGKRAEIEMVDNHTGGWGHINVDQIVFSNKAEVIAASPDRKGEVPFKTIAAVAEKNGLDHHLLTAWVKALNNNHPLSAWENTVDAHKSFKGQAGIHKTVVWEVSLNKKEWFLDGFAFDPRFEDGYGFLETGPVTMDENIISSSRISPKMMGSARSPDFIMTDKGVTFLARGDKTEVRLIIENYQMEPRNGLLFKGTRMQIKSQDDYREYRFNAGKYAGRTCYIEFNDDGNGWFEVKGVNFDGGRFKKTVVNGHDGQKVDSLNSLINSLSEYWMKAFKAEAAGTADAAQKELYEWVNAKGLLKKASLHREHMFVANKLPNPQKVITAADGTAFVDYVHVRGSYKSKGVETPRRFLEVFSDKDPEPFPGKGSGRLQLAEAIVKSPMASRVMVNRLWHHLTGRGIVASVDDFGVMGQRPTHPQLLDWLAADFMKNNWSVKKMIKKIVMSKTYRQSSKVRDKSAEAEDPDNLLLHRMNFRRMSAEQIRDSILAVSSRLITKMYGPSIDVNLTSFMEGRGRARSGPLDGDGRRSLYLGVRRNFLSPMMLVYDFPVPFNSMGKRTVSNVPAQALTMLNDPFIHNMCEVWAGKLMKSGLKGEQLISFMFESALGHLPLPGQMKTAKELIGSGSDKDSLKNLCHLLFNVKSFIYVY